MVVSRNGTCVIMAGSPFITRPACGRSQAVAGRRSRGGLSACSDILTEGAAPGASPGRSTLRACGSSRPSEIPSEVARGWATAVRSTSASWTCLFGTGRVTFSRVSTAVDLLCYEPFDTCSPQGERQPPQREQAGDTVKHEGPRFLSGSGSAEALIIAHNLQLSAWNRASAESPSLAPGTGQICEVTRLPWVPGKRRQIMLPPPLSFLSGGRITSHGVTRPGTICRGACGCHDGRSGGELGSCRVCEVALKCHSTAGRATRRHLPACDVSTVQG